MVRTIEDLLAYKKELATARIGLAEEAEAEPEPEPPYPAEEPVPGKEEEENRRLYKKLDAIVTTRQLFLNQILSREELMKLIRVDKNRFSRILQQNTNKTMLAYLNDKRMEYAAELLKTHPENNIATVAKLC